jgi:hypothetical protein
VKKLEAKNVVILEYFLDNILAGITGSFWMRKIRVFRREK